MRKLLSAVLAFSLACTLYMPSNAVMASGDDRFIPNVTYKTQVTDVERSKIHAAVDALAGDVGDMRVGDGTYDPFSLIGALAEGSSYDSISHGRQTVPTEYPFSCPNTESNRNEGERKTAKFDNVMELCEALGFNVIVHPQEDKYVYVEIGDPDAPEMVMALSHLDSPTGSISAAQLERWRNADGEYGAEGSYHAPYVKDGWLYGAGVQDDSGPTLATLFAAKALMDAGVLTDRRIRIVMGAFEDGNPGTPSAADTLKYMDIPYYTSNPSFYDNWCYKSLNREETPIAGYTSDSRFPVVVGNTKAWSPKLEMDLSNDTDKTYSLLDFKAGVTLREGDPTLKDIVYGSANQVASRAIFTLNTASCDTTAAFKDAVIAEATRLGWLPTADGTTAKIAFTTNDDGNLVLEINTDVAMEYPMPMYGKNAIVWGMYLIKSGLEEVGIDKDQLVLKKAADGFTNLFFQNCEEGEAYIGKYFLPENLLRHPDDGAANITFALGQISNEVPTSYFDAGTKKLSVPVQARYLFDNAEDCNAAIEAARAAFVENGFVEQSGTTFSQPSLYLSRDNLLTALQMESYLASMSFDPEEFADVYDLIDISYPVGTTGGTLASNYVNKMTAFGAVIPGNERWWHTANERISVSSIIEMTKMMADGMLEMARYSGGAGAQYMWADIEGYNANRAELDLLDVTVGTYQDATASVSSDMLGRKQLLGATSFNIPMWKQRGNSSYTQAQYDLGHEAGGCYLPLDDADFLANTFVLPMRLEFKISKPDNMSMSYWKGLVNGGYTNFNFSFVKDGVVTDLKVPDGMDPEQFYDVRFSEFDDSIAYVCVNLALIDGEHDGVEAIVADSKTDLYKLNDEWLETHEDPFPERGQIVGRGFFLFGDGSKDAEFISPDAIFVTAKAQSSGGGSTSAAETYAVTVSDAKNGDVTTSVKSATEGTTVTVTATPNAGYQVAAVAVTDKNGTAATLTDLGNCKYSFKMPASNVTVSVTFAKEGSAANCPKDNTCPMDKFSDTDKKLWYHDGIHFCLDKGLMAGTSANSFAPDGATTRGQIVTILWRLEGEPVVNYAMSFTDVAADQWYTEAIRWAQANGIVAGYSADKFGTNDPITREQMATILYRYADFRGYDVSVDENTNFLSFNDFWDVSEYAKTPMMWAIENGLIQGNNWDLNPQGNATRAQAAVILQRYCENIIE